MTPSNKDRPTHGLGSAPKTVRNLFQDGLQWRVFERAYPEVDRRCGMSLIFDAESVMRRVRDYPVNWSDLSDDELYALSLANA